MRNGGLDAQEYRTDWPMPTLKPGYVMVQVHACGLNNTDVNTRTGWYSPSNRNANSLETGVWGVEGADNTEGHGGVVGSIGFPRIQGADAAGVIVATGAGVSSARVGNKVIIDGWFRDPDAPANEVLSKYIGQAVDGGFAEYMAVPSANAVEVNTDLSFAELATFQVSSTTAENILDRANVTKDTTLILSGASGRTGGATVQHAKLRGAYVIGLARPSKHEYVKSLGADVVVDSNSETLRENLAAAVAGRSVTAVGDLIGGPLFPILMGSLAYGGKYVVSGAMAGPIVELDLRSIYTKEVVVTGATMFDPRIMGHVVDLIEDKRIEPRLAQTFPLSKFNEAQTTFMGKDQTGAIVVVPDALYEASGA